MEQPAIELESTSTAAAPQAEAPRRLTGAQVAVRGLAGVGLGLGVALLAAWLLDVKVDDLLAHLRGVPRWAIGASAGSGFVVIALQALRWRATLFPLLGVGYPSALRVQVAVAMLNGLLPARGGDLLKIEYFSRRTGISRARILGTELVDRWLDFWGWIPTFILVLVIGDPPSWLVKALGTFGGVLAVWAVLMFVLARRGFAPRPESRLGKLWIALRSGMDAFASPRIAWIAVCLAPLPWLWEASMIAQISHAFGIELTLVMAFSVLMAFNLAMAIPAPGAVGTIEAGGTAALVFFGFDQSKALAFMIVYHLAQLLPSVFVGGFVLALGGDGFLRRRAADDGA